MIGGKWPTWCEDKERKRVRRRWVGRRAARVTLEDDVGWSERDRGENEPSSLDVRRERGLGCGVV